MASKSKESNNSVYAIVGIVAIVAVVGLISILADDNKTSSSNELEEIDDFVFLTSSFLYNNERDCLFITDRPCYMRGAKAPVYWTRVGDEGAENAYNKCLLNPVLTGSALMTTTLCGNDKKEVMYFCYQGHGFALYYLNGKCTQG